MKVGACSPNLIQMTPFGHSEWLNQDFTFWLQNMHPEDREFAVASFALSMEVTQNTPKEKVEMIQINIYIRMLDCNNNYRWVLIQFPKRIYDEEGKVLSTFILITDLSHLTNSFSRMLTMMDSSNNENIIFATQVDNKNLISLNLPQISKRELEILQLMARGQNSPQIAESLFLSYHTVENHKRNLRRKTNTKTSAELIDFVWRNNLI
jgi:DNA-binding CsgD family transcriptional regulator